MAFIGGYCELCCVNGHNLKTCSNHYKIQIVETLEGEIRTCTTKRDIKTFLTRQSHTILKLLAIKNRINIDLPYVLLLRSLINAYSRNLQLNNVINQITIQMSNSDILLLENECAICLSNIVSGNFVTLNCDHSYCANCMFKYIKHYNSRNEHINCPTCRSNISQVDVYSYYDYIKYKYFIFY
jgi:hypothetical protein